MVDLKTLLLLMSVADLALAAALWLGASRRKDGLAQWSVALVVRALAFGLVAGSADPRLGALAVGSGLLALSITLQASALVAFARRQLPAWVHTAVIAAVALPMQLLANDPGGAILFGGVVLGLLLLGQEIRGIHVQRAHTDGDTIVHFLGSDVIHMGDVYFNGLYPFIDTASGGSVEGTIAACDQVLKIATEKTRIIPGHGPLSSAAELKAYRDMLSTVLARVKRLVADGRKPEEIAAAGVSKEFDEKWGKGFLPPPRFVESVARDVLKNR